jgi:hypothetical protein
VSRFGGMESYLSQDEIAALVGECDCAQFHRPGNRARNISVEASGKMKLVHWSGDDEGPRVRDKLARARSCDLTLAIRVVSQKNLGDQQIRGLGYGASLRL